MPTHADFTRRFCHRWIGKANRYRSASLESSFDKFFTLFVAFNRLYSFLADQAFRAGGDHQQATRIFADIVGRDQLWTDLLNADRVTHVQRIGELIGAAGHFNITFDRATHAPDSDADDALRADLLAGAPPARIDAVLEVLYQVRCNLFHGRKDYEMRQTELLTPCVVLLESLLATGLKRLDHAV